MPFPSRHRWSRRGWERTKGQAFRWLLFLLFCPLVASPSLAQEQAGGQTGKGAEEVIAKGSVNVLGKEFADLPMLWRDEPFAPVGEWLKGLGLSWTEQGHAVTLQLPQGISVVWTPETLALPVRDASVKVTPLLEADGRLWLPLLSLGRLLGLRVLVNAEKRQVKLLAACQRVSVQACPVGWLMEVTMSYPLPSPPRLGTLSQPDRAYADFDGACLDPSVELPSVMDSHLSSGILKGVRVGQFSSDPPIVRVVVDAQAPLRLHWLRRQPTETGGERWIFLLQSVRDRKPWLGQITLDENATTRAVVRLQGWFGAAPTLSQKENCLILEVPALPLLTDGEDNVKPTPLSSSEGVIQDITMTPTERATRIVVTLRAPLSGQLRPFGDDAWLLVIEPPPQPLRQRLIVVDAGHGGHDPGALSPFSPLTEKQLTLDIALRLRRLLEQAGYRVQMTRETDVYLSLADRVALANRLQADAFVSVHLNSFPHPGGRSGTEVYYWKPQSLPLAEAIYRNLLALLGRKGNGVRQRRFYVIHHTTMPSVLVEACYLNHPEEEQLLRDENFRQKIALAIFRGIAEFFGDQRILQRAPKEATGE